MTRSSPRSVLPGLPPRTGWAFEEVALRHGDFAIASVAATVSLSDGLVGEARLAVGGTDETPLRLRNIELGLVGDRLTPGLIEGAAAEARAAVNPGSDLRASADYRRHLVGGLVARALAAAWDRAQAAA